MKTALLRACCMAPCTLHAAIRDDPDLAPTKVGSASGWLRCAAVDSMVPVIGPLERWRWVLNSYLSHLLETG